MLHWGVQCENRKKTPPQHKSTYTIDTTLQQGETYPALASSHPVRCHLFWRRSQTRLTKPGGTKPEALGRGKQLLSRIYVSQRKRCLKSDRLHLHLVIFQTLLSKATYNWGIHNAIKRSNGDSHSNKKQQNKRYSIFNT